MLTNSIWLKDPLAIYAENADGGIVIRDGKIAELIYKGRTPHAPVDETFDASAHVILPGLINTHHHFCQTLTRVLGPALNKELFDWLKALYPVWAGLTPDMLHVATEMALSELLLSGCTTSTDHHYVFPSGLEEGIDVQVDAARQVGTRVVLTRGSMNLSVKDGGLPPDSVVQDMDCILADSARLVERYHERADGAMVQIALAPCSPFSVTRGMMAATADLARELDVLLHTHLAETQDEAAYCWNFFGMSSLDYLEECGWMEARTWLAHGIHFDDAEATRLGAAGVSISSCSHSNMTLASGICPVCDLEKADVGIGLGVDGSASNDASNMIEEVRQAFMLQRLRYGSAKVTHLDAIRWATEGSAKCLNRKDIGLIATGLQADLALFKLDEMRHSGHDDSLAALIICGANRADYVMIGGKWRVAQGQIIGLDVQELIARHSTAAATLRQSAGL